jgi:hypothetical protein
MTTITQSEVRSVTSRTPAASYNFYCPAKSRINGFAWPTLKAIPFLEAL